MKNFKKLIIFVFVASFGSAMELHKTEESGLGQLPPEVKIEVLNRIALGSADLTAAVKNIKNYMILAKNFNFFNDPVVTGRLIELLHNRFRYEHSKVIIAAVLQTQGAAKWLENLLLKAEGKKEALAALMYAISWRIKNLDFLLKHLGSLINEPDNETNIVNQRGLTPLMLAAANSRLNALKKILLVPGLEINKRDSQGHTALWHAKHPIWREFRPSVHEIIKLLKEHGAIE